MLAYGKLPAEALMDDQGKRLGFDFSGQLEHDTCIGNEAFPAGQRIMGIAGNAIATKVAALPYLVYPVPETWSLAEAATVPMVYSTAYFALIMRGDLQEGQSVLIHSGAGAVGLAAIRICLSRGCEVYTTCSNNAKKSFLLKTFPELKAENIGDSRSCSFEQTVMNGTNGRGVDLCLNSLDQDKLQASIRCLAEYGTLLEIGKYDMVLGSKLPMRAMLKGVSYHSIMLEQVIEEGVKRNPAKGWQLHKLMWDGIKNGEVTPLPFRIFTRDKAADAFRFLAKGLHIGKALVQMHPLLPLDASFSKDVMVPEPNWRMELAGSEKIQIDAHVASSNLLAVHTRWTCRHGHAYIITGGLGGFGLALAQWLAQNGATHIVLTSTRGIQSGKQRLVVQGLEDAGVTVHVSLLDVKERAQTAELLKVASSIAPVAGIFHLAMRMSDKLLANQTGEGWNTCVRSKADGAINLDIESRSLAQQLDLFVLFSSTIAEIGNAGQANYGFANHVCNEICIARKAADVPGVNVALQWGAIGDVGVLAQNEAVSRTSTSARAMKQLKLQMQPVDDCLEKLGYVLAGGRDTPAVVSIYACAAAEKEQAVSQDLVGAVLGILGIDLDNVKEDEDFTELGLDSMQVIEVRHVLQCALGRPVPIEEVGKLSISKLPSLVAEANGGIAESRSTQVTSKSISAEVLCKANLVSAAESRNSEAYASADTLGLLADELDALLT
eukprot:jgi/Botrbrau1/16916/Bobra.0306s0002.1